MTWGVHLLDPRTGQRGKQIDYTPGTPWSITLNGTETLEVKIHKDDFTDVPASTRTPWRGGLLLTYTHADTSTEVPFIAGPLTKPPSEETTTRAKLTANGIRAFLTRRYVIARDYGQDPDYPRDKDMIWLARSTAAYQGMSYGTIAQEIVDRSTSAKLGGDLPITYASPRELGSTLRERTYEGWNIANNNTDKRLTELSDVRGGPDIMFRPRWVDPEHTFVEWAMVHGTHAQPTIAQTWTMSLDDTADNSPIQSITPVSDAEDLTNRVFWTGAGEGAGTLIRMAQADAALAAGMPLLESTGATSDSDNPGLIQEHADARLAQGRVPMDQLTVRVDGSDERCRIGDWQVGDLAQLTVGDRWWGIAAGTYDMRIIAAKGTIGSPMVDLEFQEGTWE